MVREENINAILFALVLVVIPVFFHSAWGIQNDPGTFWPAIISISGPYVFLALLFLSRFQKSQRSAFFGAVVAWLCMMAVTVYLAFWVPEPKGESRLAMLVVFPFVSIPYLILPSYLAGVVIGRIWDRWRKKKNENNTYNPFQ